MNNNNLSNNYAWAGQNTTGAVVLGYFCEDDQDELHRRQIDINKNYAIENPQEQLRTFYLQSRTGMENLLMSFKDGVGTPCKFYHQIVSDIHHYKAEFVILDNAAQLFGGNENYRSEVTQFVNLLHRLSSETGVTILVLGHPAKADGSEYSGSTAWDACFRSRLFFGRPKDKDQESSAAGDMRILRRSKANYSRVGDEVQLRWHEGVFVVVAGEVSDAVARIDKRNHEKLACDKFLEQLDKLTAQGRNVSHSVNAKNYAPRVMKTEGISKKQLAEAMETLLDNGTIIANAKVGNRPNRGRVFGLVRAETLNPEEPKEPEVEENDCDEVHAGHV